MSTKTLTLTGMVIMVTMMVSIAFNSSQADTNKGSLETVVLDIPSMHCASCPLMVKKTLEKIPGVKEVTADINTKTARVSYDSRKTNPEDFIEALKNDIGYQATIHK